MASALCSYQSPLSVYTVEDCSVLVVGRTYPQLIVVVGIDVEPAELGKLSPLMCAWIIGYL